MPTIKSIAQNEVCQVGECAEAISVRTITDQEKLAIGMAGEIQLVLRFPGNRELRVPVSRDVLDEAVLDPPVG